MSMLVIPRYLHRSGMTLEALGIELPEMDDDHPNRVPFAGVLTKLDQPSTRPPGGSNGHKVYIAAKVAEAALPSLIGMPVNVAHDYEGHEKKQPIGTIAEAHISGDDLCVSGFLYGKNFPHEVAFVKQHKDQLGMSYEISDVQIDSEQDAVWHINSLMFTGASILFKDKAAYAKTSVSAAADPVATLALITLQSLHARVARLGTTLQPRKGHHVRQAH